MAVHRTLPIREFAVYVPCSYAVALATTIFKRLMIVILSPRHVGMRSTFRL